MIKHSVQMIYERCNKDNYTISLTILDFLLLSPISKCLFDTSTWISHKHCKSTFCDRYRQHPPCTQIQICFFFQFSLTQLVEPPSTRNNGNYLNFLPPFTQTLPLKYFISFPSTSVSKPYLKRLSFLDQPFIGVLSYHFQSTFQTAARRIS